MARHKPIDKTRWLISQKEQVKFWKGNFVLEEEIEHIRDCYNDIIQTYADKLPKNSEILDIGCGPACSGRFVEKGNKTFLDPLLDRFRRNYPGKMPKGEYLDCMAEDIPRPDHSYDMILCFNTLSYVLNPELVLCEAERLLKKNGYFIISMHTASELVARLRYFGERFFSPLRNNARPYYYTHHGIIKTLARHFEIVETKRARLVNGTRQLQAREDWIFVCKLPEHHKL